jgi:hypothetical protein
MGTKAVLQHLLITFLILLSSYPSFHAGPPHLFPLDSSAFPFFSLHPSLPLQPLPLTYYLLLSAFPLPSAYPPHIFPHSLYSLSSLRIPSFSKHPLLLFDSISLCSPPSHLFRPSLCIYSSLLSSAAPSPHQLTPSLCRPLYFRADFKNAPTHNCKN